MTTVQCDVDYIRQVKQRVLEIFKRPGGCTAREGADRYLLAYGDTDKARGLTSYAARELYWTVFDLCTADKSVYFDLHYGTYCTASTPSPLPKED